MRNRTACRTESDCFTGRVQFILNRARQTSPEEFLTLSGRQIPMALIHNPRARRFVLRLRPDGVARVTIPRRGSTTEARRFAERNKDWLERQLQQLADRPSRPMAWLIGTDILFRGESVKIEMGANAERGTIQLGGEVVRVADPAADLRPAIERHLWRLAAKELPSIVLEYAALHRLPVRRVSVRNQKSRWGSCSRRGKISLNWRLIQTPTFVRDYVVAHEVMHLKEMNHSARFWTEVQRAFPDHQTARQWLKQQAALLK